MQITSGLNQIVKTYSLCLLHNNTKQLHVGLFTKKDDAI